MSGSWRCSVALRTRRCARKIIFVPTSPPGGWARSRPRRKGNSTEKWFPVPSSRLPGVTGNWQPVTCCYTSGGESLRSTLLFITVVWGGIIYMNERYALFSVDQFSSALLKAIAYVWLGAFLLLVTFLVVGSSMHPPTAKDLARVHFFSLFALHGILIVFLLGWWLLTRRP